MFTYKLVKCTTTCNHVVLIYMYVRILLALFYFKALLALQVFVTLVASTLQWTSLVMGIVVYVRTLHALVMMLTNEFSPGYQFSSMWNLSDVDEQGLWPLVNTSWDYIDCSMVHGNGPSVCLPVGCSSLSRVLWKTSAVARCHFPECL